jgi:hypothetical protein
MNTGLRNAGKENQCAEVFYRVFLQHGEETSTMYVQDVSKAGIMGFVMRKDSDINV